MKPIFKIYNNNKVVVWTVEASIAIKIRDKYYPDGNIKIEWLEG